MLSGMTAAEYPACTPGARYGAAQLFFVAGVYGAHRPPGSGCDLTAAASGIYVPLFGAALWASRQEPRASMGMMQAVSIAMFVLPGTRCCLCSLTGACASPGLPS
jgi:hypothetical protein